MRLPGLGDSLVAGSSPKCCLKGTVNLGFSKGLEKWSMGRGVRGHLLRGPPSLGTTPNGVGYAHWEVQSLLPEAKK